MQKIRINRVLGIVAALIYIAYQFYTYQAFILQPTLRELLLEDYIPVFILFGAIFIFMLVFSNHPILLLLGLFVSAVGPNIILNMTSDNVVLHYAVFFASINNEFMVNILAIGMTLLFATLQLLFAFFAAKSEEDRGLYVLLFLIVVVISSIANYSALIKSMPIQTYYFRSIRYVLIYIGQSITVIAPYLMIMFFSHEDYQVIKHK